MSKDVAEWLDAASEYLDEIAQERGSKSVGSQPMFKKSYRGPLAEYTRRAIIYVVKGGEKLIPGSAAFSRFQVPDLLQRSDAVKPLMFIKSVSSLCRAHMFVSARPGLKVVHIVRHPCAYVASTLRGKKLGLLSDDAYVETLANMPEAHQYGFTLETLRSMSREEQLTVRWMLQNEKVMREMQGCENYHQVIYEDLCVNTLDVIARIFQFLDLDVTQQTRDFIDESSAGKSENVRYFDVKRDSSQAATGWQKELSIEQIEQIKGVVAGSLAGRIYFPD